MCIFQRIFKEFESILTFKNGCPEGRDVSISNSFENCLVIFDFINCKAFLMREKSQGSSLGLILTHVSIKKVTTGKQN